MRLRYSDKRRRKNFDLVRWGRSDRHPGRLRLGVETIEVTSSRCDLVDFVYSLVGDDRGVGAQS